MLGPHLEIAQRTDPGRDPNKQINEDAAGYQLTRLGHLLVVCDGMGGHALGQEASQLALRTIVQMVEGAPPGTPPGVALRTAIAQAGRVVYQMGGVGPQAGRPGSTCVAALVHAGGAEIAHVGDSRVYLYRRGQVWQITKDHSVVQQMIDLGTLKPDQAIGHPEANKITRALGMKAETEVELRETPLPYEPDDILLLATDGLCDLIRNDEIATVLSRAPTLDVATEELVRYANSRGGHDNITVQLARVRRTGAVAGPLPEGPGPTLVDRGLTPIIAGPEKTVVDPPVVEGPRPTVPHAVAPAAAPVAVAAPVLVGVGAPVGAAPAPAPAPVPVPVPYAAPAIPQVGPSPAHFPPAAAPPMRTNPGAPPSRGGCLALGLGLAVVALILAGILVWWFLRGPH
jgi:protein phosphatase